MMTEATPIYEEMVAKYPGLFDNEAEWQALVADPEHELVPVPAPSFTELLEQLAGNLPERVVAETRDSVGAELLMRTLGREAADGGDGDNGGPTGDAEGAEPAGAAVVVGDGGEDRTGEGGGDQPQP